MSMPRKPDFQHAVLKAQRAKRHIADFDTEASKFFGGYPYDVAFNPDLEDGRYGYRLWTRRPFPELRFGLIVGDVVHNLRSALDYLVAACAIADDRTINDTAFPIVREEAQFEGRLQKKARKAGPVAMQVIRGLKPYAGGNDALVVIHQLDLTDKHRLIEPVACTMEAKVTAGGWNALPHKDFSGTLNSAHSESQFIPVSEGYEAAIPTEVSYTGEIVFAPDTPLAGEPCVEALNRLVDATADAISEFEAAFDCIGLSKSLRRHDSVPVSSSI